MIENYLTSVKEALWQLPVSSVSVDEAQLALHLRQGTATLVFPRLTMTPAMKAVCVSTMQQQVKLHHTLTQAWTALIAAGIRPLLMKGAGLAALYAEPQLRAWGDIDLFVGKDQYHPACAVMRDTFPDALKFDEELDHYKHYNIIADGVSIETHRVSISFAHPADVRRYAAIEAYGMSNPEKLTLNGLDILVPEPTFNALFVCLHSWEHMQTSGANVRQLCDLALLLHTHADSINRPLLQRWLKALRMTDVWQLYMYILVQYLGLPQNEAPFFSDRVAGRAARLINDLLSGKMVAPKPDSSAPKNRFARKLHTMRERMRNADRMAAYTPAYARHMKAAILLSGLKRLFAKDRHWE